MAGNITLTFESQSEFFSYFRRPSHHQNCLHTHPGPLKAPSGRPITIKVPQNHDFMLCHACGHGIDVCTPDRKAEYLLHHQTCSKKCQPSGTIGSINDIQDCLDELSQELCVNGCGGLVENESTCDCCYRGCDCIPHADDSGLRTLLILRELQNGLQNQLLKIFGSLLSK